MSSRQATEFTFLERQHRKSLGIISHPLREYNQFLSILPSPESHIIDILVARLTLPNQVNVNDDLDVCESVR